MKQAIKYALLIAWIAFSIYMCYGCAQLVHKRPDGSRLQINTLFKLTDFDGLYNDPEGFLEIRKYSGVPANIKLKFNPFLNQYEMVIEADNAKQR